MAISLSQVQRQSQKLIMTPQMQQSIQLLQMSSQELEQLTTQEMMENPFLEVAEDAEQSEEADAPVEGGSDPDVAEADHDAGMIDFSFGEADGGPAETGEPSPYDAPDNTPEGEAEALPASLEAQPEHFGDVDVDWNDCFGDSESRVYTPGEPQEEEREFTEYVALKENLHGSLKWQLHMAMLSKRQMEIGEYILGSLDDDGYLRTPLDEIATAVKCEVHEVETVLGVIQTFEPVGVGSRDLAECLRLQLLNQGCRDRVIIEIVDRHLDALQKKKFKEISKELGVDEAKVREAFHRIGHLEPKPGRERNSDDVKYIQPDVFVKKVDERYMIHLHEGKTGGLRINRYYRNLLRQGGTFDANDKTFATDKLKSAIWLIKNIEKRKSTILKVSEAIMAFQKDFLDKGISGLRPLTLKDIAEVVGMHESTVARVTTSKYIETPRGIFELKYFFGPGLNTEGAEDTSSRSIKDMLAKMIAAENPRRPHSDQKLAELVRDKGVTIARRTVAKYREQLKILPAKMRRAVG